MVIPQKLREKVRLNQRFNQTVSYFRGQNREESPPKASEESKNKNQ